MKKIKCGADGQSELVGNLLKSHAINASVFRCRFIHLIPANGNIIPLYSKVKLFLGLNQKFISLVLKEIRMVRQKMLLCVQILL